MRQVCAVIFRWVSARPKTKELESIFDDIGNWARFNSFTWLVDTEMAPPQILERFQSHVTLNDSVFIAPIDMISSAGWTPNWFIEWVVEKRDVQARQITSSATPKLSQLPPIKKP